MWPLLMARLLVQPVVMQLMGYWYEGRYDRAYSFYCHPVLVPVLAGGLKQLLRTPRISPETVSRWPVASR